MPVRISLRPALLLALATLLVMLAAAPSAFAIPTGCENPEDCPPTETTRNSTLTVTAPAAGTITSSPAGISCPGDCSQGYEWTETCYDVPGPGPDQCEASGVDDVVLSAARGTGWAPDWSGCTSETGTQCNVHMDANKTVSVSWIDIGNPTVGFSSPAAKAGPSTVFTANAADGQSGVKRVDFYVDNVFRASDFVPPYAINLGVASFAHGSQHELKVIALDNTDRTSSNLTNAPSHDFTVDKLTGLLSFTTPAAYVQTPPPLSFVTPADVTASGVTCRTKFGPTTFGPETTPCASPYTPVAGGEGPYSVEVVVRDDVGNVALHTRSYTIDTTAPAITITEGPANDTAIYASSTTFRFAISDGAPLTTTCSVDGGAFGACSASDRHDIAGLAAGSHTFTVRSVDAAGNPSEVERRFAVIESLPTNTGGTTTTTTTTTGGGAGTDGAGTGSGGGTGGETGGGTGGAATGTGGPAALPLAVQLTPRWRVRNGRTRVIAFTLRGLSQGAVVTVSCSGRRCPFTSKTQTAKGATLNLLALFKKRALRAGTVLTVRVTQDGRTGALRFTTRKGRRAPGRAASA